MHKISYGGATSVCENMSDIIRWFSVTQYWGPALKTRLILICISIIYQRFVIQKLVT
jgi:uncharacterized membrane protein YhdT